MADKIKFKKSDILDNHGDVEIYRNLYEGKHSELFERAKHLIQNGEITDRIEHGKKQAKNIRTPYVVANMCRVIVDIPTLFISRSLGDLKTNYPINEEEAAEGYQTKTTHLEMVEEDWDETFDLQQDTLDQITDSSNLSRQHAMNLKQWQMDGGIVLVPEIVNGQAKLTFKERNVYYELDDGKTYQLRFYKKIDDVEYLHVHQETEKEKSLEVEHFLYKLKTDGENAEEIEEPELFEEITGIAYADKTNDFPGRKRKFFEYLPYAPTFNHPLGVSALEGQQGKQDEVNWTITRAAQTFERNGKPRISVSPGIMDELQSISLERYGTKYNYDHQDLEVTEMDEQGNSLVIHQIDVSKIGDISYVKDIIKMMLMETQTSEQAVDFFANENGNAQSGVAKYYEMLLSIMKSEQLRDEYVDFIQRGVESCLWLLHENNKDIKVERPSILQKEVIPVTSKEVKEENNASYVAETQSLETTVRNNNPDKSEEWILNEVETIESEKVSTDSMSFIRGNMTATNFNDNKSIEENDTEGTDEE